MFHFVIHRVPTSDSMGYYYYTLVSNEGFVLITSKSCATKEDCLAAIVRMKLSIADAKVHEDIIQEVDSK